MFIDLNRKEWLEIWQFVLDELHYFLEFRTDCNFLLLHIIKVTITVDSQNWILICRNYVCVVDESNNSPKEVISTLDSLYFFIL